MKNFRFLVMLSVFVAITGCQSSGSGEPDRRVTATNMAMAYRQQEADFRRTMEENMAPMTPEQIRQFQQRLGATERVAAASRAESVIDETAIRAGIAKLLPDGAKVEAIKPGPMPGLSEITVDGRISYVTNDGVLFVQGPIIDLRDKTNLSQRSEAVLHAAALAKTGREQRIVFPSTGKERFKVTVFTDVSCGYCQELHRHIEDYNAAGITVEYLPYPREGTQSAAAAAMRKVWCSADRRQTLTTAMNGGNVPEKACEDYVAEGYALGQRVQVRGTPAIYGPDGRQLGGFLSPASLLAALEGSAK